MIKLRLPQLIDVFCQPSNEITTQRENQLFCQTFLCLALYVRFIRSYFLQYNLVINLAIITFALCRALSSYFRRLVSK